MSEQSKIVSSMWDRLIRNKVMSYAANTTSSVRKIIFLVYLLYIQQERNLDEKFMNCVKMVGKNEDNFPRR